MRIAITHPYYWPYVRRGSERYVHDLSQYLAEAGHEVEVITSKPGWFATRREGAARIIHYPQLAHPFWGKAAVAAAYTVQGIARRSVDRLPFTYRDVSEATTFIWSVFLSTLVGRYDVVYCAFFGDCFGVRLHQPLSKRPFILFFSGVPVARALTPVQRRLLVSGLHFAAAAVMPSQISGHYLRTDFGKEPTVIPPGICMDQFQLRTAPRVEDSTILCVSSSQVELKNLPALVSAFELVQREIPNAKLQLCVSGDAAPAERLRAQASPASRDAIEVVAASDTAGMARLYANASVTVQPSLYESFGLALAESLACGTPVVAAKSGALPELVDDPRIGSLFDVPIGNDGRPADNREGICRAILEAFELNRDHDTPERCRHHVSRYDWRVIGPEIERLCRRVAGGSQRTCLQQATVQRRDSEPATGGDG